MRLPLVVKVVLRNRQLKRGKDVIKRPVSVFVKHLVVHTGGGVLFVKNQKKLIQCKLFFIRIRSWSKIENKAFMTPTILRESEAFMRLQSMCIYMDLH